MPTRLCVHRLRCQPLRDDRVYQCSQLVDPRGEGRTPGAVWHSAARLASLLTRELLSPNVVRFS
jgi:hypothetical protein